MGGRGQGLAGALAGRLRERIARGELQPGDRLPGERELAESLGVHRGSLREALRQLERLRLVSTRPGSGTRVLDPQHASFDLIGEHVRSDPDGRWLRDLLEVRELVAGGALQLLLERDRPSPVSPDDVARALEAVCAGDVPEPVFLEALWGLPASLSRASGNQALLLLANSSVRFLTHCESDWVGSADRRALASITRRLARALSARDLESAERASRDLSRQLGASLLATRSATRADPAES